MSKPAVPIHTTARKPARTGLTLRQREAVACALFIAPAVIGFLAFAAIPLLASAWLSLTDYALAGTPHFVGLSNYQTLLGDKLFWNAVRVTATYALFVVPLWLVSSLLLALVMNQPLRGVTTFRAIYYLPALVSGVAISMLWAWMFNPRTGLINTGLGLIGIEGPRWLSDKNWALTALILMTQWGIGWYLPTWLGGLQGIPTELYEAAELDGANAFSRLCFVTLPMLSPIIVYNLVMNLIWATQFFTEPMMMTGGGPEFSTLSYVLYLYNNAFSYLKMGQASAMAWLLFVFSLLLTVLVFKSTPMWVHYESERKK